MQSRFCTKTIVIFFLVSVMLLPSADFAWSASSTPQLAPPPRQVQWSSERPLTLGTVAIVIGDKASPPEQYAAQRLQEQVAKRFDRQWPIKHERDRRGAVGAVILIGQRGSNRWLDLICSDLKIDLSDASPGHDGYVIEMLHAGDHDVVLVGGSNARGVIYGQDTLFQLLSRRGEDVVLARASIRDWPSVPWRGRPQTAVSHYLRPGELDLFMSARINFIDLRGGIYAFEPGTELDQAIIAEVVKQARRRGLIVYGTVNCGVPSSAYGDVLKTFKELLALGADGLWLSFDDKGPGEDPVKIVTDVLELGRQHGITGSRIAFTPPKGSYQEIDTAFNRKIIALRDVGSALWFWSRIPCAEDVATARSVGLKTKPAWWHNWPRLTSTHAYIGPPSMATGWHAASYEDLTDAGPYVDAVMPWGGNAWGQYYIVPVIGWWAWNPKDHNWRSTRFRIYDAVFGPGQAAMAMAFDDTLVQTKSLLCFASERTDWRPCCPARLKRIEDRSQATALMEKMENLLGKIEKGAAGETMLDAGTLSARYLDVMRKEWRRCDMAVRLAYPEYWWGSHQKQLLTAIYDGDTARADELITAARPRLLEELAQIAKEFGPKDRYVRWWTERANLDARVWQELIADRRKELAKHVHEYGYFVAVTSTMLQDLKNPPIDWGTGRWQVSNKVLATVLPTEREQFWGAWIGGLHRQGPIEAAVFAAQRKILGAVGEFSELPVDLPISGKRDRLALLLFLSNVNKHTIGGHYVRTRWAGYRFIQLLWEDKVLWEADLGPRRETGEWFLVRLPAIPADVSTLPLRLRVEDRKLGEKNYTIAYVGPIRLLELPD